MMSLCAVLAFPIEERVRKEYQQGKTRNSYKINRTSALAMTREITCGLLLRQTTQKAIEAFDRIAGKTIEIVRPGRKFERKKKPKRQFHMNYKPL